MPPLRLLPLALLLAGCAGADRAAAPSETPVLRAFGDGQHWVLERPLAYRDAEAGVVLTVPAGFVTDFASVPAALRSLVSPTGRHLVPAIVHDYLYWAQACTRRQADRLFLRAMRARGVDREDRLAMYRAVRLFGGRAWDRNADDREQGRPRLIPASGVRAAGPTEPWDAYRAYLASVGASAAAAPVPAAACALGD